MKLRYDTWEDRPTHNSGRYSRWCEERSQRLFSGAAASPSQEVTQEGTRAAGLRAQHGGCPCLTAQASGGEPPPGGSGHRQGPDGPCPARMLRVTLQAISGLTSCVCHLLKPAPPSSRTVSLPYTHSSSPSPQVRLLLRLRKPLPLLTATVLKVC